MATTPWMPQKLRQLASFSNLLLLVLQVFVVFVMATVLHSREQFEELSHQFYGPDAPLMNSAVADLLVRPELLAVIVAALLASLWKELKVASLRRRMGINGALLAALVGVHAWLTFLLFAPTIQ